MLKALLSIILSGAAPVITALRKPKWEKCPSCGGDGKFLDEDDDTLKQCPACEGEGLISKKNGQPPKQ